MFSSRVRENRKGSCSTTPMFCRSHLVSIRAMSTPPMVMRPHSSGSAYSRSSSCTSVDLPAPVPPSMPTVSPLWMVKLTSSSTLRPPSPYRKDTCSKQMSPSMGGVSASGASCSRSAFMIIRMRSMEMPALLMSAITRPSSRTGQVSMAL